MTAPVLELAGITVRAGRRLILDVPEFAVAPAETVALIGPNGAGKTTLLHVAALLRQPDTGQVAILGQPATKSAARLRRSLSVVFQAPLLFNVSVLANAAAGLRFQGETRQAAENRARIWLERFGVADLARRGARGLSGGESGRVALARAFATEPAILLLDEPFSALDAPSRAALVPVLREQLRATGTAAVLVTHDLDEAFAFGDRIALMDQGRIIACGDAPGLIARPPSVRAAALLGVETILPATVTRREGDSVTLFVDPSGPSFHAADAPAVAPGERVTLTLPAGAARVFQVDRRPAPGLNALRGQVVAVTLVPSGTRLVLETPARIHAFAPWESAVSRWRPGDRATVAFPPEAIHVIRDAS